MTAAAASVDGQPPLEQSLPLTLGAFFTQTKVSQAVIDAFHDSLGTDNEVELTELLEMPEDMAFENFKTAKLMGETATPLQVSRLRTSFKKAIASVKGPEPAKAEIVLPGAAPLAPAPMPVPDPTAMAGKRKLNQVLDQTDDSTFVKLTQACVTLSWPYEYLNRPWLVWVSWIIFGPL